MTRLHPALKALVCLFFISFLTMPVFASDSAPIDDEIMVSSTNPIMVIRCKRERALLESQNSKSISKDASGPTAPYGYKIGPNGGIIPDCNAFSSVDEYTYNASTGECDCTNTVDSGCSSFCAEDLFRSFNVEGRVVEESCNVYLCPGPNANGTENGTFAGNDDFPSGDSYFANENGECITACYDGELEVEIPAFDCSSLPNIHDHIPIEICFTATDDSNPLIPGQRVPIADIQNCFGDEGEVLLQAAIDANGGQQAGFGEEYYFDEVVNADGKLCVEFFVDPDLPLVINFSNSRSVIIPTCFEDPCSCDNNNIVVNDEVVRFYDALSNLGSLPVGGSVTLWTNNNNLGFTNAAGTPIANNTVLANPIPASGELNYEFYRASGEAANLTLMISDASGNSTFQTYISPTVCNSSDCLVIPTMGQWTLWILGLILTSLGLVYIRRKAVVKS